VAGPTNGSGGGTTTTAAGGTQASVTTAPGATTSAPAHGPAVAPPNVVGQSQATAQGQLQAAGYDVAAHPWGGTCSTPGQVMQQVPPQDGTVQIYYCPTPS
jgi:hypothetical protein